MTQRRAAKWRAVQRRAVQRRAVQRQAAQRPAARRRPAPRRRAWLRRSLQAATALSAPVLLSAALYGQEPPREIRGVIQGESAKRILLAVTPVLAAGGGALAPIATEIQETLNDDLAYSGFFEVVDYVKGGVGNLYDLLILRKT